MTRYKWTIKTGDDQADGDSGDVYLSLHGLNAATKEVQLPPRDFAKGSVETGVLQVKGNLGELQTGSLRTDGGDRDNWNVDYVKVQNLDDGTEWTAQAGVCDANGSCPLLRFTKTTNAVGDSGNDNGGDSSGGDTSENESDQPDPSQSPGPDLADRVARLENLINKLFPIGPSQPAVTTYELYATWENQRKPLFQVVNGQGLIPGARLYATSNPREGYGLGGSPGRWAEFNDGKAPTDLGLDADKPVLASDGVRGWPVASDFLTRLLGANWRQWVYQ